MAPSKLRKAIGVVKDQTSISLAKVGGSTSLADLDVAIVKATRHEEYPAEERHIREILSLTVYSRGYVGACVSTISRRLNKTKNWVVAIKALMLIHRLLNDGDPAYEQEIFFATRRGTRLLNLYDFRDTSRSDSWDYSAFVRTYALYLDEQLEYRMQGKRGKRSTFGNDEGEDVANSIKSTPFRELQNDQIFSRLQHMLVLLERFLACRPTGAAKSNRVVIVALYSIVKESFQIYYEITEIMGLLLDRFMDLGIPDSLKVHEIFCRVSKQYDELDEFYVWSKSAGIARSSEYPKVDKISNKKLDIMDEFIREKSLMEQNTYLEPVEEQEEEAKTPESVLEPEDINATKALPPPEEVVKESEKEEVVVVVEKVKKQDIGDLLNLGENAPTTEQYADKQALALFDGGLPENTAGPATGALPWQAFNNSEDWETSLVQSASHLSNQKPTLPGGFDSLMLAGMYQQGSTAAAAASSGYIPTGSASSVALGSAGRPAVLALPAPESAQNPASSNGDPFAASLAVPPPSYVQMSEMEKKQMLLVDEQMMWQKYTGSGMKGQVGLAKVQQYPNAYPYNMGGNYAQS